MPLCYQVARLAGGSYEQRAGDMLAEDSMLGAGETMPPSNPWKTASIGEADESQVRVEPRFEERSGDVPEEWSGGIPEAESFKGSHGVSLSTHQHQIGAREEPPATVEEASPIAAHQEVRELLHHVASSWAGLVSTVDALPSCWQLPSAIAEAVICACDLHAVFLDGIVGTLVGTRSPLLSTSNLGDVRQARANADSCSLSQGAQLVRVLAEVKESLMR